MDVMLALSAVTDEDSALSRVLLARPPQQSRDAVHVVLRSDARPLRQHVALRAQPVQAEQQRAQRTLKPRGKRLCSPTLHSPGGASACTASACWKSRWF